VQIGFVANKAAPVSGSDAIKVLESDAIKV
jgi:hypothetical protein